jgi:L-asparaginase II
MNCSGKHAAFLLTCLHNRWPIDTYLDPQHPLQRLVRATVEDFAGEPIARDGVDGCGAPVFALSLRGLARAIARVGVDPECAVLRDAIRADPWAFDSPAVATAIERLGVIAKAGAEGVFVAVAPDGTAVALKVIDGSMEPGLAVALTLLQRAGALPGDAVAAVLAEVAEPVLGGGEPVGALRVTV